MALRRLRRPQPADVRLRDTPADYTGSDAPERVLIINLFILRYGTSDRFQGAAIFLAFLLLLLLAAVVVLGIIYGETPWSDRVFGWLGSAFLIVAGVAIGRATSPRDQS
jgi:arginine exporter protein ArgO